MVVFAIWYSSWKLPKNYLPVLEDCAQCFLGRDAKGCITGTVWDVRSWSFENSKQLTSGDGGIIASKDEALATNIHKRGVLGFKILTATSVKVRVYRDKFHDPYWERFDEIGYNYRMN
jgi:perosamine synthetase